MTTFVRSERTGPCSKASDPDVKKLMRAYQHFCDWFEDKEWAKNVVFSMTDTKGMLTTVWAEDVDDDVLTTMNEAWERECEYEFEHFILCPDGKHAAFRQGDCNNGFFMTV